MTRSGSAGASAVELAIVAPALLLLAALVGMLTASAFGYRPLGAPADLTLSEAAALHDSAEIARQIQHGADPSGRYPVRHGFRRSRTYNMTPLEAATASDRDDVIELLVRSGARLDPETAASLICFATRVHANDAEAFFKAHAAQAAAPDCGHVETPW